MKKKICAIVTLLSLFICIGCGNASKDNINDELNGLDKETSANASDEAGDITIPDRIKYTVSHSAGMSTVDAKVDSKGYSSAATYSVEIKEKNDEWLDSYAGRLFDGEYENIKPDWAMNYEEMIAERDYWKDNPLDANLNRYDTANEYIDFFERENLNKSDTLNGRDTSDLLIQNNLVSYEEDDGSVAQRTLGGARLRGNVGENIWELYYDDNEYSNIHVLQGVCLNNIMKPQQCVSMDNDLFENKTDYDTAKLEAESFAQKLAGNDMVTIHSVQCEVIENRNSTYNGYVFVLAPKINTGAVLYNDDSLTIDNGQDVVQPFLRVGVNDKGICNFVLMNDCYSISLMDGDVSLLSFEKVNEIAKEYIESEMERGALYDITEIRFGYILISYDGKEYAAVPAWGYYYYSENYDLAPVSPFSVCALDGAIIKSTNHTGLLFHSGVFMDYCW